MTVQRSLTRITLDEEETRCLNRAKEILDEMLGEVKSDRVSDFVVIDDNTCTESIVVTDIMLDKALQFLECIV